MPSRNTTAASSAPGMGQKSEIRPTPAAITRLRYGLDIGVIIVPRFVGSSRSLRSVSRLEVLHKFVHGEFRLPGHSLPRTLDQTFVTLPRARDGLRLELGRRLWHAREEGFHESINECEERLLSAHDAVN